MADGAPKNAWMRVACMTGSCFLLISTGWLSWMRHVIELAGPADADMLTMVLGYLVQAAGIAAAVTICGRIDARTRLNLAVGSVVGFLLSIALATLIDSLAATLAFGYLANVLCGLVQGCYLTRLAEGVGRDRRGIAFGCAYGASTVASWLLSLVGGGLLVTGVPCLAICLVLAGASIVALRWDASSAALPVDEDANASLSDSLLRAGDPRASKAQDAIPGRTVFALACAAIAMASLVKNMGFDLPAEDLASGIDLELSRVFYGVGLVVAGFVFDRDRRVGMALCGASLALPFLLISLAGSGASAMLLWSLEYLFFGFFTIFRVTLTADLADDADMPWLAGLGMAAGRVGDAVGTSLYTSFATMQLVHVAVAAVAFAIAAALMFVLALRIYSGAASHQAISEDPQRAIADFCGRYGLSAREREVLPLLLAGKTNAEIAAELFVTERTVKYHVHNILAKTGRAARLEVVDLFNQKG